MQHVLKQVRADSKELKSLPYAKWYERVEISVRSFVPELVSFAPDLMQEVKLILNSPRIIRETWERIELNLPKKLKIRDLFSVQSLFASLIYLLRLLEKQFPH